MWLPTLPQFRGHRPVFAPSGGPMPYSLRSTSPRPLVTPQSRFASPVVVIPSDGDRLVPGRIIGRPLRSSARDRICYSEWTLPYVPPKHIASAVLVTLT